MRWLPPFAAQAVSAGLTPCVKSKMWMSGLISGYLRAMPLRWRVIT
ncbi:hypothetical protein KCP78_10035 [Salmonella enterica subsp. enterica]|nr:hypothetical protein KCP78_10035 [Salmonella enterica subsp. enterica]